MANIAPFMQRRGNHFSLRISVPASLRPVIGSREIVKTLRTCDRRTAAPIALEYAAKIKRLFHDIQTDMSKRKASRQTALNEQFSERWKAALKEVLNESKPVGQTPQPADQDESIRIDLTTRLELPGGAKIIFEDVNPEDYAHVEKIAETFATALANQPAASFVAALANQPTPLPTIDASSITGHAPDGGNGKKKSKVVRGYERELELKNKQLLLEAINFDIELTIKPTH